MCLGAISFAAVVSYHPNGGRWLAIAYKSSFNYCAEFAINTNKH